jgi:hypothetical protein
MLRRARWELKSQAVGSDPMTLFAARIESIKQDLPASGVIGYMTDPPDELSQELIWTRYYLAPLIVLPSTQHRLVLGNFHKPVATDFLAERRLVLTKDYGDGILLFTNPAQ